MPHSQGPAPITTTLSPESNQTLEQDTLKTLLAVASFVGACISSVYTFIATRTKKTDARIEKVEKAQEASDKRLTAVERNVEALPSKEDIHQLDLLLVGIRGELDAIRQMISGQSEIVLRLERVVLRHEDHLLDARK